MWFKTFFFFTSLYLICHVLYLYFQFPATSHVQNKKYFLKWPLLFRYYLMSQIGLGYDSNHVNYNLLGCTIIKMEKIKTILANHTIPQQVHPNLDQFCLNIKTWISCGRLLQVWIMLVMLMADYCWEKLYI